MKNYTSRNKLESYPRSHIMTSKIHGKPSKARDLETYVKHWVEIKTNLNELLEYCFLCIIDVGIVDLIDDNGNIDIKHKLLSVYSRPIVETVIGIKNDGIGFTFLFAKRVVKYGYDKKYIIKEEYDPITNPYYSPKLTAKGLKFYNTKKEKIEDKLFYFNKFKAEIYI